MGVFEKVNTIHEQWSMLRGRHCMGYFEKQAVKAPVDFIYNYFFL